MWWLRNRPAAVGLFDEELARAIADLGEHPTSVPVFLDRDDLQVRRMLLPKTRCHVYFVIDDARRVVEIVAVWGARTGRLPRIAKAMR